MANILIMFFRSLFSLLFGQANTSDGANMLRWEPIQTSRLRGNHLTFIRDQIRGVCVYVS